MRNNIKISMLYFLILLFSLSACQPSIKNEGGWQKVYQNDQDGQSMYGEKDKLLNAVRLGYPVRIGWGSSRIEHVADADFLTIFQGEEVFAQIKKIIGQAPSIQNDSLKINFRKENHWTKIASTNGYTSTLMTNYLNDSIVGGRERYSTTTWYVLYPNYKSNIKPMPLWHKESPNWNKWNEKNK